MSFCHIKVPFSGLVPQKQEALTGRAVDDRRHVREYFLTLVQESSGELTLVVVPRTKGVSTRHMAMSGSTTAGTAFVEFDDVEVSLDMVVGERGKGFKYIVSNFNHEVRLCVR